MKYKAPENLSTVELLMVDDDELDVELFERSLKAQKIANPMYHCENGEDALEFLRHRVRENIKNPLVVLMDINMPKMGGIECVRQIRADDDLKSTIVFILTTSDDDRDVLESYKLNVAGYLVKGKLGDSFVDGVTLLDRFWKVVELPVQ